MTGIPTALIGYGYAGKTFHAPLITATPGFELTLIASSDAAKVRADLPAMEVLRDPMQAIADARIELVVIAAPNATHATLARAALQAGKHVVVDKPFTLELSEARELAALAASSGQLLSVFHNRRWDSDYLGVKRAIEEGLIGEVMHFESHFDRFRPQVRARWREQDLPGSGIWYDLGPHLVDQALQLFGTPERVIASLATQREHGEANDWAHVLLEYGERRAILHAGMLVAGGGARFTVHGVHGSLVKRNADRQETQLLAGMRPGAPGWGEDEDDLEFYDSSAVVRRVPVPAGDQRHFYAGIRDALRGGVANPVTPAQAVAVMAVLEAAGESARRGCAVPPPLTEEERAALR